MIVAVMSASVLLLTGCGSKAEPVSAEPREPVSEVGTEESLESTEPTPSPTTEPTEEPVEESSVESESTIEPEESSEEESPEESTIIEIAEELDQMMYVQTSANARSGDSTDYDVVTTFSINTQVHVTGKTVNNWFRVEQSDGEVYVSGKLLGMDKVVVQQQSNSSSAGGQFSGDGNGNGGDSQQPAGDDGGGAVAGDPAPGGGVWQDSSQFDWSGDSDWVWH